MIERVIILPTRDNNGVSLRSQLNAIRHEILLTAGGYSETKQVGAWRDDDGTVYHDVSVRLTTTVDETQDARIVARLPEWCAALRQACLYTHSSPVSAAFVYPASQEIATVA